jgi:hypothetical protein
VRARQAEPVIKSEMLPDRLRSEHQTFGAPSKVSPTGLVLPAEAADDIKIPIGYRNWFHVNAMIIDWPMQSLQRPANVCARCPSTPQH